jgi:GT2 family glycosyltransferase
MNNYKIKVSIVIYDTNIEVLRKCIFSIKNSLNVMSVIDIIDHSKYNQIDILQDDLNDINYFHNPLNPGYGAGNNFSIKRSISENFEYHLVINPDVYFEDNVLRGLLSIMEDRPNIGLISPKILSCDGTIQFLCKLIPSPLDLFLNFTLTERYKRFILNKFQLRYTGYNNNMLVPYLSGCFMLMKVSYLKSVGLFDERFFLHMEDLDLSRRLFNICECIYEPGYHITHLHNAESKKYIKSFIIHFYSFILYYNKWGWFKDMNRVFLNKKAVK